HRRDLHSFPTRRSSDLGEDWFGFIFRIDAFSGTPRTENAEGTLQCVPLDRVLTLPLWEGDRHFLPLVFERIDQQFHGVMPYRDRSEEHTSELQSRGHLV